MTGIVLMLLLTFPELTDYDASFTNTLLIILILRLIVWYGLIRFLKKSGRMKE